MEERFIYRGVGEDQLVVVVVSKNVVLLFQVTELTLKVTTVVVVRVPVGFFNRSVTGLVG